MAHVGYYRVSTQAQGRSGLGLEAQQRAVRSYVSTCRSDLLAEFSEVESGGSRERNELEKALALCKSRKATLVIARLDRLARNVYFISKLMESGVEFVAADMPAANKFTIQIIAAMAEYERDLISQRTKTALAAAKLRGTKLGNPRIRQASRLGAERNHEIADAFAAKTMPIIDALKRSGFSTYSSLARALNEMELPTQRKRSWTPAGVRNVILRAAEAPNP